MSECTPTTPAEESPVWEAADRLRHHGFPWLAELVEEMARERAKLQDRIEELEKNLSYEVEQKIKLADMLRAERTEGENAVLTLASGDDPSREPVTFGFTTRALD